MYSYLVTTHLLLFLSHLAAADEVSTISTEYADGFEITTEFELYNMKHVIRFNSSRSEIESVGRQFCLELQSREPAVAAGIKDFNLNCSISVESILEHSIENEKEFVLGNIVRASTSAEAMNSDVGLLEYELHLTLNGEDTGFHVEPHFLSTQAVAVEQCTRSYTEGPSQRKCTEKLQEQLVNYVGYLKAFVMNGVVVRRHAMNMTILDTLIMFNGQPLSFSFILEGADVTSLAMEQCIALAGERGDAVEFDCVDKLSAALQYAVDKRLVATNLKTGTVAGDLVFSPLESSPVDTARTYCISLEKELNLHSELDFASCIFPVANFVTRYYSVEELRVWVLNN